MEHPPTLGDEPGVHVAIVCPYSMSTPGGVQEHARGLARALVALGHQVSLFGPEFRGPHADLEGVLTVSLGRAFGVPANGSVAPLGLDPRMLVRLDLALDPADVVHVHEPFLPAGIAATLRTPKVTPVVGTFHAAADRFWPYAVTTPALRRLSRRFRATTAVSPAAAQLVRRYVPVNPVLVPNGIACDDIASAQPDPWASSLGRVVLFVGRDEPRKGAGVVRAAFAAAAAEAPDWHLVTTAGPSDPGSRVHGLGRVDHARRDALLRSADIVCCASLGGESFGLVVVEALAAGAAVLASDIPGYRYAGGDAPRYVAPGDVAAWSRALRELMADDAGRASLAAAGPARARIFDWTAVARSTLEVYAAAGA